jgi:hypothetical protein
MASLDTNGSNRPLLGEERESPEDYHNKGDHKVPPFDCLHTLETIITMKKREKREKREREGKEGNQWEMRSGREFLSGDASMGFLVTEWILKNSMEKKGREKIKSTRPSVLLERRKVSVGGGDHQ